MSTKPCSGRTALGLCAHKPRYAVQQGIQGPERLACGVHLQQVIKWQLDAAGDGVSVFRLQGVGA